MSGPGERATRARIAALTRWLVLDEGDRRAATAPAREALARRLSVRVDPAGVLDDEERARRLSAARRLQAIRAACVRWHGGAKEKVESRDPASTRRGTRP
jgi:hypothetical protein